MSSIFIDTGDQTIPGSLAPWDGKKRNPGNEVVKLTVLKYRPRDWVDVY